MRGNRNESNGKCNQGSMNNFKKTYTKFQQITRCPSADKWIRKLVVHILNGVLLSH